MASLISFLRKLFKFDSYQSSLPFRSVTLDCPKWNILLPDRLWHEKDETQREKGEFKTYFFGFESQDDVNVYKVTIVMGADRRFYPVEFH